MVLPPHTTTSGISSKNRKINWPAECKYSKVSFNLLYGLDMQAVAVLLSYSSLYACTALLMYFNVRVCRVSHLSTTRARIPTPMADDSLPKISGVHDELSSAHFPFQPSSGGKGPRRHNNLFLSPTSAAFNMVYAYPRRRPSYQKRRR